MSGNSCPVFVVSTKCMQLNQIYKCLDFICVYSWVSLILCIVFILFQRLVLQATGSLIFVFLKSFMIFHFAVYARECCPIVQYDPYLFIKYISITILFSNIFCTLYLAVLILSTIRHTELFLCLKLYVHLYIIQSTEEWVESCHFVLLQTV